MPKQCLTTSKYLSAPSFHWTDLRCQERQKPSVMHYTSYITVCAAAAKPDEAFAALEEMKKEGIARTAWTYNALINCCVRARDLKRAFSSLNLMIEDNLIPG